MKYLHWHTGTTLSLTKYSTQTIVLGINKNALPR